MVRKIKLDLHTHPIESLRDRMGIKGIGNINRAVAGEIVKAIKAAGVDGIAITEYHNFNHSWVACLEILDHFRNEKLVVLPGTEIAWAGEHYLQIYIPEIYRRRLPFFNAREWFVILAHPADEGLEHYTEIAFDAVEEQSLRGNFAAAEKIAQHKNVPRIKSSAAHRIEDIGRLFTEFEYR
jgi:hypothetical protein